MNPYEIKSQIPVSKQQIAGILNSLSSLDEALERVNKNGGALLEKLEPILKPYNLSDVYDCGNGCTEPPSRDSHLLTKIEELVSKAHRCANALDDISIRVQL